MSQIMQHVQRRVNRRTAIRQQRRALEALKAASRRYAGGTEAERSSHGELRGRLKQQFRAAYFGRIGRRIDLLAMLRLQRDDREPVWAIIDPRQPIARGNDSSSWNERGSHQAWGPYVGGEVLRLNPCAADHLHSRGVSGCPALPARVRSILASPMMRQAKMVGLLYQPEEWQRVNPDPAIVVEWIDRPGEYYAFAVWGHDGPRIMEFVD